MNQKILCRFCGSLLRSVELGPTEMPRGWDHEDVCWDCNEYGWKPVKKAGMEGLVFLIQQMIRQLR